MTTRVRAALLLASTLGVAAMAVGVTQAAFSSSPGNAGNSYSVAPDFVAPVSSRRTVADPGNSPTYAVRQCRFYQAYAQVTDSGNPTSGVAAVEADLTGLSGGSGRTPLVAGSYTLGGLSYNYRSLPKLATAAPGNVAYSLYLADGAGNSRQETGYSVAVGAPPAVAAVFLTGVEQGVASASAPGVFDVVSGAVSVDGTIRRNGTYSLRVAPANAAAYATATLNGSGSVAVARFAIRFGALPTSTANLASLAASAGTPAAVFSYDAATGRFGMRFETLAITSGTVTPAIGSWYVIEMKADLANRTLQWRIDGVDQPQVSATGTAASIVNLHLGTGSSNVSYTANFDDVIVSRTATDYPIGNGKVLGLAPNGMGTHNTAGNFRNNDNTIIDSSTWTRVDEVPATSTADFIKQITVGGTSYIELTFADTAEPCINAVGAEVAYHSSLSGTNAGKTSIFSGSTESVVYSGSMGSATLVDKRAMVSSGSGGWTTSLVNALVARVGYSTNVYPVPYWDALLLEYDVPISW